MTVRATYRLQLHRGWGFDAARERIDYLVALGVSHLYLSPILTARAGSTHGYDVVDHRAVNPELGGEDALRRLAATSRARGIGLIVDIVPNHMAVGADNAWWLDALEWGEASRFAGYFDIDWRPGDPALEGKMLAPFLGRPYGEALVAGELRLGFDAATGRLVIRHFDQFFPLAPRDYAAVIDAGPVPLPGLARAITRAAAAEDATPRWQKSAALQRELAEAVARAGGEAALAPAFAAWAPDAAIGAARLHLLLERQNFRLASWRAAPRLINWRRFFDINDLAALRVERDEVFDDVHATTLRLHAQGVIDGVRVDHVDGLADPAGYCRRLRAALDLGSALRPRGALPGRAPLFVEKILARGEELAPDWPVDGTTGYDFMNEVGALLHDDAGEPALTRAWARAAGDDAPFEACETASRREILERAFATQLDSLARRFRLRAAADPRTVEIAAPALRRALAELLAHFRAYRPYPGPTGLAAPDRARLGEAHEAALRGATQDERAALDAVAAALDAPPDDVGSRFAQLSATLAAKAVEDTAFYRYGRLLSRNEVGSDPGRLAGSPAEFHDFCERRAQAGRRTMNATASHDHKRGEDSRARLAVLSELADAWETASSNWLARAGRDPEGPEPDAADAAMLCQAIVGAWPAGLSPADGEKLAALRQRLAAWQTKALREAKRRSSWSDPDEGYERACQALLERLLDPARPATAEIAAFAARIAPASAINGLAQTVLKLAAPGVPDLYQGSESWDWSLVDPDNRAPVDFAPREAALAAATPPAELLADWRDGRVKQAVIARVLALRRDHAAAFSGEYAALAIAGAHARHAVAFARGDGARAVVVVATRLPVALLGEEELPRVPPAAWGDTAVALPEAWRGRTLRERLGDRAVDSAEGHAMLRDVLASLPVAVLTVAAEDASEAPAA